MRYCFICLALILVCPAHATIVRSKPVYPDAAYRQCIEGFVVLSFEVIGKGTLGQISVAESVPAGVFDNAAIGALRNMAREEGFASIYPHKGPWKRRFIFEISHVCTHQPDDARTGEDAGAGI